MVQDYVKNANWHGMEIVAQRRSHAARHGRRCARRACRSSSLRTALVINGDSVTRMDLSGSWSSTARKQRVALDGAHPSATSDTVAWSRPTRTTLGDFLHGKAAGRNERRLHQRRALSDAPRGDSGNSTADEPVSIEKEVFPQFCGRGFYAMKGEFPFIDIGTPESYRRAGGVFPRGGRMIISRTPYRISFFGGGTDYPAWYLKESGAVLSTTIDKYCYISAR